MRRILLFLMMTAILVPLSNVYAFTEKGQDCSKCHTLSKEDAATLLKDLDPNIRVTDVKVIPLKGFWEVDVESGGRKGLLYVDYTKKYFLTGSIFDLSQKRNLTKERFDEINRVDVSKIPLDDALVMGDKDAKYRVIVFDDPE